MFYIASATIFFLILSTSIDKLMNSLKYGNFFMNSCTPIYQTSISG